MTREQRQRQDYETLKHFWRWAKGIEDVKAEDVSRVDTDFGVIHDGVQITFPLSENLSKESIQAKVFQCREIIECDLDPRGAQVWNGSATVIVFMYGANKTMLDSFRI